MGGEHSTPMTPEETAAELFSKIQADYIKIGIDDTLLLYSGTDSGARLLDYSSNLRGQLVAGLPDFIEKAASALGGFTPVPNAVSLGAFVISMILQLAFLNTKGLPDTKTALRSVFAEEKSSMIRDLIVEYLKRYEMHLRNDRGLLVDSERLETQLSMQLSVLRNSILVDNQVTSRAINHWINGAAFHTQVLLHIARLKKKTTKRSEDFENAKRAATRVVDIYSRDMKKILEAYKEYKRSKLYLRATAMCAYSACAMCNFKEGEIDFETQLDMNYCEIEFESKGYYLNYFFSNDKRVRELEVYFSNVQSNLDVLVNQEGQFQIQS